MRSIKKNATSQSIYFDLLDSTSTTGGRKTGLAFNTSSLVAYYVRNGGSATAITLATLAAANSAWSSGGFKEVDATNMPGIYRLDLPDAAVATGADSVAITIKGATGLVQSTYDIQLSGTIDQTGDSYARLGAPAGASLSADIAAVKTDTAAVKVQTDKLTFTVANQVDANVLDWKSATAPAMTGDAYARLGAPAGASTAADIAAVKVDTAAVKVQTDKLTFTVANQVDSNVLDWKSATAPAMTGDAYARLGAPAGASVSADIATVAGYIDTEVAAIKTKTDQLTFTAANKLDANVLALNGDATSAANIAKTTRAIGRGTVTSGATTTSIPTSAMTPTGVDADQFKGRIITFDADTATTALRGQSTDITANTAAAAPTFTVSALSSAPASGDTFSIT